MVVYYPFDGNINDYGPNGVELSVYGNPKPTNDGFETFSAFYFDGERDFMLGDASIFLLIINPSLSLYGLRAMI